jgi:rRNA-processing protein FCF1
MMAKFDSNKYDIYDAINPVVAALFIPKFAVFEKYTLNANLARVINNRYNNIPSKKDYDENLVEAILADPNETICTNKSKMEDILRRCHVQVALWNAVLSLRNSRCYHNKVNEELLKAVNNCNATDFDTPEFMYFGSEDILLKKLLATFSFRPIITRSIPLSQLLYKPFAVSN